MSRRRDPPMDPPDTAPPYTNGIASEEATIRFPASPVFFALLLYNQERRA